MWSSGGLWDTESLTVFWIWFCLKRQRIFCSWRLGNVFPASSFVSITFDKTCLHFFRNWMHQFQHIINRPNISESLLLDWVKHSCSSSVLLSYGREWIQGKFTPKGAGSSFLLHTTVVGSAFHQPLQRRCLSRGQQLIEQQIFDFVGHGLFLCSKGSFHSGTYVQCTIVILAMKGNVSRWYLYPPPNTGHTLECHPNSPFSWVFFYHQLNQSKYSFSMSCSYRLCMVSASCFWFRDTPSFSIIPVWH